MLAAEIGVAVGRKGEAQIMIALAGVRARHRRAARARCREAMPMNCGASAIAASSGSPCSRIGALSPARYARRETIIRTSGRSCARRHRIENPLQLAAAREHDVARILRRLAALVIGDADGAVVAAQVDAVDAAAEADRPCREW